MVHCILRRPAVSALALQDRTAVRQSEQCSAEHCTASDALRAALGESILGNLALTLQQSRALLQADICTSPAYHDLQAMPSVC